MSEVRVVDLKELGVSKEVFDKIYSMGEQDGRADVIDEVLQIIHNTYTQDLHCLADMCDRDNQGYDCEDCLYKSIKQNLEQLKEQKND